MPSPTHHLRHKFKRWEVDIYIPPIIQTRLESEDPATRSSAQASVCTEFKIVCAFVYHATWNLGREQIEWCDLQVDTLA